MPNQLRDHLSMALHSAADTTLRHRGQGWPRCITNAAQALHVTLWLQGLNILLAGWSRQMMHRFSSLSRSSTRHPASGRAGLLASSASFAAAVPGASFMRACLEARMQICACKQHTAFAGAGIAVMLLKYFEPSRALNALQNMR